ncbi:pitrilysin family protein [Paucibacter sp. AS339]|uniref:M16 family metallopeptidase n=1 Tax=Paucibacter hankyongi TaxID=3133434 RepID=UPI0030B661AD
MRRACLGGALARRWVFGLGLALSLGWAAPVAAQLGFDRPPPPAPALPLQLPVFQQASLANGMRLVVVERRGLPLVTALLSVQAGHLQDPPGKSGLSELSLAVLSKGARQGPRVLDAAAISHAADALGGGLELSTGALGSRLSMTVMTPQLDESLALLAALSRTPTLPKEELERSRAQMLDALLLDQTDPAALAEKLARRIFWGDAGRGRLASAQTLARIKLADVQAFCREQMRPERLTLVLAGDLDLAQGRVLAQRHFGNWRPAPAATAATMRARPDPAPAARLDGLPTSVLLDLPGSGQSAVLLVAPFVGLATPEPGTAQAEQQALLRAGALANAVLGLGYSSRINQEVRIKRGLSYGAFSSSESLPGGGMLSVGAQTQHVNAAEVAGLLRDELQQLGETEVTAPELAARQALLIGELGRQLDSTQGLAATAAEQLERGEALADLPRQAEQLYATNAAAVRDFAARFWAGATLRSVVVADLAAAGAGLLEMFPQAWVIPVEQLDLEAPGLRKAARRN